MSTVVINSNQNVEDNLYSIPNRVTFRGMKLKWAAILNNQYNVISHQYTITLSGVPITQSIPDGNYSGADYAKYLQDALNRFGSGTAWTVQFNKASSKFSFQYVNTNPTLAASLSFNTNAQPFVGNTSTLTFPVSATTYLESPNMTVISPGYYRVCSDRLSTHGFMMDNVTGSATVAIIPISADYNKYTIFNNDDNFYQVSTSENDLYNFIDVRIYIEDSNVQLANPKFCLVFQFV